MKSTLIPQAAKVGFRFHHAEGDIAVLFRWLRTDTCKIQPFATHQVGVAGKCTVLRKMMIFSTNLAKHMTLFSAEIFIIMWCI